MLHDSSFNSLSCANRINISQSSVYVVPQCYFLPQAPVKSSLYIQTRPAKQCTSVPNNMVWLSWLRHCATSQKIAGSSLHGVIVILIWLNLSGNTMIMGSTKLLIEMCTRGISWWVKAAGASGWKPCYFYESQTARFLRASWDLYRDCFTFTILSWSK